MAVSISFLAALAASIGAAAVTVILVRRFSRLPRLDLAAWAVAAAAFTVALAALAIGYHQGFTATTFRAVQITSRLAAPLALLWGLTEVIGKTFWARYSGRLVLVALTVIGCVILAADPLSSVKFTTAWPRASVYYQVIPGLLLLLIAGVTALGAVIALLVAGARARGEPGWGELFPVVAAAAAAVLLTEGLQVKLPVKTAYPALCLAAAALTWFAGQRSGGLSLARLHGTSAPGDDTGWRDRYEPDPYEDEPGYPPRQPERGRTGRVATDGGFSSLYRPDAGGHSPGGNGFGPATGDFGPDTDFRELYRSSTGGFGPAGSDTGGFGFYRTDTDLRAIRDDPEYHSEPVPGLVETGDMLPVAFDVFTPMPRGSAGPGEAGTEQLYGQIAIYTLIDGQAEEFDRLAQQVVERVKALEPNTLVYIVHGVPSAPMQRILYEVYRDEAAFEEHARQPYVRDFDENRKPFVLATNVIELGVRQAKLSPLDGQPGPAGAGPRHPAGTDGPPRSAEPRYPAGTDDQLRSRGPDGRPARAPGPDDPSYPRGPRRPAGLDDPRGPRHPAGPPGTGQPAGPYRSPSQPERHWGNGAR